MTAKKILKPFLTGLVCMALFTGCATDNKQKESEPQESSASGADGKDTAAEGSVSDVDANAAPDTYKAAELFIPSQETYENPDMGLSFTLPEKLREQMDLQTIAMLSDAQGADDNKSFAYFQFTWNVLTKEQKNAEIKSKGNGFNEWADGLKRIGAIGVYHSDQLSNLDKVTKCTDHKELGKSEDGVYTYYLSTDPKADKELAELISQIQSEITKMTPPEQLYENENMAGQSLGAFTMKDIKDNPYSEKLFQDHALTMVNVFTTWCTPCINEIPDLEKLHQDMADMGVNIVGIVLDARDEAGDVSSEAVQKAELLAQRTKASYPFLIPDEGFLNGRLKGIEAVPETFFVDKNGTIVGNVYSGSHSYDDWKTIIEDTMKTESGGEKEAVR